MKGKNPIQYKVNRKANQLFNVIKGNANTFFYKLIKSLKMLMVRPSYEQMFNKKFKKIMEKITNDANLASQGAIDNMEVEEETEEKNRESMISLNTSEISALEDEIRKLSCMDLEIEKADTMELPEYVVEHESNVGPFKVPEQVDIVHQEFVDLQNKRCVRLNDDSLYEGQWNSSEIRWS